MKQNAQSEWYQTLDKPSWAPPSKVFGPVWTVLYILIFLSFGSLLMNVLKGEIPTMVFLPFFLNIIFNLIFTPIQFGLKNNGLAAVDIILVLGTLVWAILAVFPFAPWIALVNIPYLLWVSFATVLQLTITWLNKK